MFDARRSTRSIVKQSSAGHPSRRAHSDCGRLLLGYALLATVHGTANTIQAGLEYVFPAATTSPWASECAADAKKQVPSCATAPKVDAYLTQLGMKSRWRNFDTHGVKYPWEFHCVNDKAINAFALPGGYVFVNRGAIEAADNEAQLAGVMAHELSHVALRHGTNQATKAQAPQGGLGIFGAAIRRRRGRSDVDDNWEVSPRAACCCVTRATPRRRRTSWARRFFTTRATTRAPGAVF